MPKSFVYLCPFKGSQVKCNYEYPCKGCEYFSADAKVITPSTDTQHLQAEIAALTIRLETYVRNACLEDKEVFDIAAKMRQLSAVQ